MERINFKAPMKFLGRNGMFSAAGILLVEDASFGGVPIIEITPITTKDQEARCFIQIPKSSIVEFVNKIKELCPEEFSQNDILERAENYLCDSQDDDGNEVTLEQQIELIRNFEGDSETFIDDIDGVCVWEPLEYRYTVDKFVEEVLW